MLTRERPRSPVRALMPAPAALPSLTYALALRASIFGPFDFGEPPRGSRGLLARCAAALRSMADFLEPEVAR